jgi:hypothetical protein
MVYLLKMVDLSMAMLVITRGYIDSHLIVMDCFRLVKCSFFRRMAIVR